jgi:hypothetical protein
LRSSLISAQGREGVTSQRWRQFDHPAMRESLISMIQTQGFDFRE